MARELISKNATKSVYRDGDKAVKVFCKGFPKAEVLNEALISARVEAIGGINIPSIQAVSVEEDGCWSITRDYIEGKTLTELMKEKPDKRDEYLNQMVELQLMIHSKTCPLLNKLKDKMARQISEIEEKKKAAEEALQTLQTEIARCTEGMEKGKSELIELLNSKASIKARQQRFDTMEEQVNIRKAQLNQRPVSYTHLTLPTKLEV